MDATGRQIIAFGYQGLDHVRVTDSLLRSGRVLVDIRLNPWCSWSEGWSKPRLASTLQSGYIHMRGLGNMERDRDRPPRLLDPQPCLAWIVDQARNGTKLALMCVCASSERCHRAEVMRLLRIAGLSPHDASADVTRMFGARRAVEAPAKPAREKPPADQLALFGTRAER